MKDSQTLIDMFWPEKGESVGYKGETYTDTELEEFLEDNNIEMLINTKDGLQNGMEEGKVALSVFSVSNYSKSNKACILRVNKDLNVVPYVIKGLSGKANWITEGALKPNQTFSEDEH